MGSAGSAHGRHEAVDEAQAEATFSDYACPVELNNCLHQRAQRNPYFLRRTLKYRAPPRTLTEQRETFELALSVSLSDPGRKGSAGQAHTTTTVFAMLCDSASEGDYVVKRAWRFQAPASVDTGDGRRIPLCLPAALLDEKASLEFVFVVWDARDGLYWVGGAGGAAVSVGMKRGCIFGLLPEGSSVSWCHLSAAELTSRESTDAAARAGKLTLLRATLCRSAESANHDGQLALRFSAASARVVQPSHKLHYSATGLRSNGTPLVPDSALAAERPSDASGGPCRVWFHYLYYRNMRRRTETTERSACPLCSLACCSFQGLQEHLLATHPGFVFSFSDSASAIPSVNVNCIPDAARRAALSKMLDSLAKEFRFQSRRYGFIAAPAAARSYALFAPVADSALVPSVLKRKQSDAWADGDDSDDSTRGDASKAPRAGGVGKRPALLLPGILPPKRMMTRPRNLVKPMKAAMHPAQALSLADHAAAGKFYHARTAVMLHPSELEEAYRDSDDEVDEQHWQTKCRRGIDEFGDVTQVEKDFMFMWNTYTHKRHIYADALLAEAVADFARSHRTRLCADPEMRRCFTLHLINLWDVCLLDGVAMDEALRLLDAAE